MCVPTLAFIRAWLRGCGRGVRGVRTQRNATISEQQEKQPTQVDRER